MKDLNTFMLNLGYQFKNPKLLTEAMTHKTFSVEHRLTYDNQRLEFLGDAVIQLILTEALFKKDPLANEGILTKRRSVLVREHCLAQIAQSLDLGSFLLLGKGEAESGGAQRESSLADAMEAVIGAIFLDSNYDATVPIITHWVQNIYQNLNTDCEENPKGALQEFLIKQNKSLEYVLIGISGPDHARQFGIEVLIDGVPITRAFASKRKVAEAFAAQKALDILKKS